MQISNFNAFYLKNKILNSKYSLKQTPILSEPAERVQTYRINAQRTRKYFFLYFLKFLFFIMCFSIATINGEDVTAISNISIYNANVLGRIALFNNESMAIITDIGRSQLHIIDINGNHLNSINPNGVLREPLGICSRVRENNVEEIFVYDFKAQAIFLFDSSFRLIKVIGSNMQNVQFISVDSENDSLYASHRKDNMVTIWNTITGQYWTKFDIIQPVHSKTSSDKLYVVSQAVNQIRNYYKRKVKGLMKGNLIYVISKFTLQILQTINFDDWLAPHSLHLSSDGYIYTLAYKFDKNGYYSKNRFLFVISLADNQIIRKIELNELDLFTDALYLNNKIIVCGVNDEDNVLRLIDFNHQSASMPITYYQ